MCGGQAGKGDERRGNWGGVRRLFVARGDGIRGCRGVGFGVWGSGSLPQTVVTLTGDNTHKFFFLPEFTMRKFLSVNTTASCSLVF